MVATLTLSSFLLPVKHMNSNGFLSAYCKRNQFCRIFEKERQREGSILCSGAVVVLTSIHQANIGDDHTCPSLAFVKDFGYNGHEIESLRLRQLQYVGDCNFWHWRLWEKRAL